MRHTPGPWIFYADLPSTEPNWHVVTTKNKLRVLANIHIEPNNPMDLANARLIASAPELLEALKFVLDHTEPPTEDDDCQHCFGKWTIKGYRHEKDCPYSLVKQVIAKAEVQS